jgi:methionyl-tRNA formyltransferase
MYSAVVFAINEPGRHVTDCLLQKGISVPLLFTRPRTSGDAVLPDGLARKKNIPFEYISAFSQEIVERIRWCQPDFIISGWFHLKIPQTVINLSRCFSVNLHPSLLPAYRGPSPVEWCIMNGEAETGLTLHKLEASFDTGEILWQKAVQILGNETGGEILKKILDLVPSAIDNLLLRTESADFAGNRQDSLQVSYYPKWVSEDTYINWEWDASKIHNRIRALNPRATAHAKGDSSDYCIPGSSLTDEYSHQKAPGTILEISDNGRSVKVVCGDKRVVHLSGLTPPLGLLGRTRLFHGLNAQ